VGLQLLLLLLQLQLRLRLGQTGGNIDVQALGNTEINGVNIKIILN